MHDLFVWQQRANGNGNGYGIRGSDRYGGIGDPVQARGRQCPVSGSAGSVPVLRLYQSLRVERLVADLDVPLAARIQPVDIVKQATVLLNHSYGDRGWWFALDIAGQFGWRWPARRLAGRSDRDWPVQLDRPVPIRSACKPTRRPSPTKLPRYIQGEPPPAVTITVVQENSGLFHYVYGLDPRRQWYIQVGNQAFNAQALIEAQNGHGAGAPGHWALTSPGLNWVSDPPVTVAPANAVTIPVPIRPLLPNEQIVHLPGSLFNQAGSWVVQRTDLPQPSQPETTDQQFADLKAMLTAIQGTLNTLAAR